MDEQAAATPRAVPLGTSHHLLPRISSNTATIADNPSGRTADLAQLKGAVGEVLEEKLEASLNKPGGIFGFMETMRASLERLEERLIQIQESASTACTVNQPRHHSEESSSTQTKPGALTSPAIVAERPSSPPSGATTPSIEPVARVGASQHSWSMDPYGGGAAPEKLEGAGHEKPKKRSTKKALDVYNLDNMHTDHLFHAQGLLTGNSSGSKADPSSPERALSSAALRGLSSIMPVPSVPSMELPPSRAVTTPNLFQTVKDAAFPSALRRRPSGAGSGSAGSEDAPAQASDRAISPSRLWHRAISPPRRQTPQGPDSGGKTNASLGDVGSFSFTLSGRPKWEDPGGEGGAGDPSLPPRPPPQPPGTGPDGPMAPKGAPPDLAEDTSQGPHPGREEAAEGYELYSATPAVVRTEDLAVSREPSEGSNTQPCLSIEPQGSKSSRTPRHSTIASLDVYNLDALHSDMLFETSGLAQRDHSSRSKTGSMELWQTTSPIRTLTPRTMLKRDWAESKRKIAPSPGESQAKSSAELETEAGVRVQKQRSGSPERVRFTNLPDVKEQPSEQQFLEPSVGDANSVRQNESRKSTNQTSKKSFTGMEELRVELERDLVEHSTSFGGGQLIRPKTPEEPSPQLQKRLYSLLLSFPVFLLRLYGVLPFRRGALSRWYQNFTSAGAAMLLAHFMFLAVQDPSMLYMHMTTACYALGGVLGVVSLQMYKLHYLLGPATRLLEQYATNHGFVDEWREVSFSRFLLVVVLWLCMVTSRVSVAVDTECHSDGVTALQLVTFALISGLIALLTYCQLHVCCALELVIDKFCIRLHDSLDLQRGVLEWNIVQAILRRAAHTIDWCFLVLNTSVLATLLLTGVELLQGESLQLRGPAGTRCGSYWFGWAFSPVVLVLYTCFRASAVTEKCSRVPALVNSWTFEEGQGLDHGRQYVVQYISHSAAGFYVKGVRLTAFMALKLTYIFGAVMFTSVTQYFLRKT